MLGQRRLERARSEDWVLVECWSARAIPVRHGTVCLRSDKRFVCLPSVETSTQCHTCFLGQSIDQMKTVEKKSSRYLQTARLRGKQMCCTRLTEQLLATNGTGPFANDLHHPEMYGFGEH